MQLVTGTPNLTGTVRLLTGDSTGAPVTQFSDTEIKDALNLALQELEKISRRLDVGWGVTTAYETSVADQIEYDLPTDMDGRLIDVIVETSGKNLDTDTSAYWTYCIPGEANEVLQLYRENKLNYSDRYIFIKGDKYGIVPPPATGGTNAIKLIYEQEISYLSTDTSAPNIPLSDHPLLCYMAGITLLNSHNLPSGALMSEAARKYPQFIEGEAEPILDKDFQIPVAGRQTDIYANKTGFFVRK